MTIEQTTLPFLKADCIQKFGQKKGIELLEQTEVQYQELLRQADDRGSKAIREHLQRKLFPPMAYYQALRKSGIQEKEALAYVKEETHKAAQTKREEMQKLAKLPFAYSIYRMGVKRHMKKNFPKQGWETEWVRCDKQEIHFNLHRCIYWEMTKQYGCPELCGVYCENDDIAFSGLQPKIYFKRSGTLGEGAKCCDFHFFKN